MLIQFMVLALRNAFRHRLRTSLTVLGLLIAILAFGLLRTVIDAWYAGVDNASTSRLVTRNSISLVFPLPIAYAGKIRQIDGVREVGWANWFGGVYIDEKNFFPQMAIDGEHFLNLYPEFVISPEQRKAYLADKRGALIGRKLANRYGLEIGDTMPIKGTIYPGTWTFVIRAIYDGADKHTDTNQMFFHWSYLNDTVKRVTSRRGDQAGLFMVGIEDADRAAAIARSIDASFKNSLAETLTETEKAFQQSFVAMTGAIIGAIQVVSFVVVIIIMAVMANTMSMAARERSAEYATLKALGFGPWFLSGLIVMESLVICALGTLLGIAATYPVASTFARSLDQFFPVFNISTTTIAMQLGSGLVVALVAAAVPAWRASQVRIVEGLRHAG